MAFLLVFVVFSMYSSCASMPPTTCTQLSVYELGGTNQASPTPGNQLPYCTTDEPQCCTTDYLASKRSTVMSVLTTSMQSDLSNVFKPWRESYLKLTDSLNEFSDKFVDNYPFPPSIVHKVQPFIDTQKPLLKAQLLPLYSANLTYNFTQFATNLAHDLIDHFLQASDITDLKKTCLREILRNKLNLAALDQVGHAMKQLQLIYQSLNMTLSHMDQLSLASIGYNPSDQCLDAILSQTCEQCQRNVPELCENMCTSAIVGCLSPLQDGLRPQIETVWNMTRQLTLLIESHINYTLRIYQPAVLAASELSDIVSSSFTNCQVNLLDLLDLTQRKRRYLDTIPLPPSLDAAVQGMLSINGLFSFNGGFPPSYCRTNSIRLDCWNGQEVVRNGTLTADNGFMKVNIREQGNNPAYSFNTNLLYQQAGLLKNSTSNFLNSPEFQSLLPSSVQIPAVVPIPIPTFTIPTVISTIDSNYAGQYTSLSPSQTSRPVGGELPDGSRSSSSCSILLSSPFLTIVITSLLAAVFKLQI